MSDEVCLEIERQHDCWLRNLFKWCPTSLSLLREAEKGILSSITSAYRGQFVNIGKVIGDEENSIWTLITNEDSDKTPIVLIHGFGSGLGLWCLNIDALSAHRPVYAFDIVGFGRSTRPQFDSDAIEAEKEFINSIECWRKQLKLEKFILLGHSFGGFLATSYAIKHPDNVSHLVLADPWGFPDKPLDVAERYNLPFWARAVATMVTPFNPLFLIRTAGPLGPKILEKARPDLVKKFRGVVKDADEVIPSYLYHCNAQNPSGESAFHSLMMGFGWAKHPMIHRIGALRKEVPITLIYGARSWVDRDPGTQIKYMRQDSFVDLQIIQGAGHHVYADRATLFNDLVNAIGHHTDEGTLPPLSESDPKDLSEGNELLDFLNVGRQQISDTDTKDEEGKPSSLRL